MSIKWNALKRDLFANHPLCKICHLKPAVHLHHAIINKGKVRNKKLHKYLDCKENALEVCESCHKFADSYGVRVEAFRINSQRYGTEHMKGWYNSLPFKVKEEMW